jgi:hypothetical protein
MMESDAVAHHLFLFRKPVKSCEKIKNFIQTAAGGSYKAFQSVAHHVLLNSLQFFSNNALRVFIYFLFFVWLTRLVYLNAIEYWPVAGTPSIVFLRI